MTQVGVKYNIRYNTVYIEFYINELGFDTYFAIYENDVLFMNFII